MGKGNKYRIEEKRMEDQRTAELKDAAIAFLKDRKGKGKAPDEEELLYGICSEISEIGLAVTALDELVREGRIVVNKRGRYRIPDEESFVAGTIQTTKRGFGFLIPDDGSEDLFIPKSDLNSAMNGDKVLGRIDTGRDRRGGRKYAVVVRIVERGTVEVTGTYVESRRFGFVLCDNKRIDDVYISRKDSLGASAGDKVRAVITKYPDDAVGPKGRIVEIFGQAGESEAERRAVIRQYGIPEAFEKDVLDEADRVSASLEDGRDYPDRVDLRDELIITIDGPDAKDLDDAVSVKKTADGNFVLGVHIADVSNYVKEDSLLDREALSRGCSVYLLDAVVPMLPEQLSNGVCSLNQGTDRLTLSMEAEIDRKGDVVSYRIFESVIRSHARMVYDDVSDIIEKRDPELMEKYAELCPMIDDMNELALILRKKRVEGGSIDFDIDETYIELDENGWPSDIRPAERRIANRIIEDFMLTANQVVAEHHFWMDVPFVYRVHEKPDGQKMESFKAFAGMLGYSLKGSCDNIHPKALLDILKRAEGTDTENIINRIMLRSMKKADYQPTCDGHFGLGFKYYCHFTSPIRRYPDLIIHRIIKEVIHEGGISDGRREALTAAVSYASDMSSDRERNAAEAERTIEKKKKVQFMTGHIGETFEGIISGVINSGMFVELPNTVEGFIPVESIDDDFYELDAEHYCLAGDLFGKIYRMGGKVKVKVVSADIITDEIEFELISEKKKRSGKDKGRGKNTKYVS